MRRLFRTAIVLALIAAMLCSGALAASYSAKVLTASMPVYVKSGGKKVYAASLNNGTSFTVTDISGDWAQISYRGKTGYAKLENIIFNKRIKAIANRDTPLKFVTRKSYNQNIYYTATLAAGTTVYAVGIKGNQLLITNKSGSALGYVKRSALTKQ